MIENLLESLDSRSDVDRLELAKLEYLYIQALVPHSKYEIPNLFRELARSPMLFIQSLAMCFKRNDSGVDPVELSPLESEEHLRNAANNAFSLLEHANILPGQKDDGTINVDVLRGWINEARELAKEYGRAELADRYIGRMLSKATVGKDGVWPREEIRPVIEEVASREMSEGMEIGIYNSRSVVQRGSGGDQERELAAKYHEYANKISNQFPFIGRMLLNIAKMYEHDAARWDSEGKVDRRLCD